MTISERLDEIEARANAATPGAWKVWGMSVMADQDGTSNVDTAVDVAHTLYRDTAGKPRTFDAEFIASARNDVPALVAALRRALNACDTYEQMQGSLRIEMGQREVIRGVRAEIAAALDNN